jgi:hypothetical protein
MEVKEQKINERQKREVEEEKQEVKIQYTSLYNNTKGKEKMMKMLDITKYIREEVVLDNSNIRVNFWQMMRRYCMRSTKSIPPSSLDIISHWKE